MRKDTLCVFRNRYGVYTVSQRFYAVVYVNCGSDAQTLLQKICQSKQQWLTRAIEGSQGVCQTCCFNYSISIRHNVYDDCAVLSV